MTNSSQLAPDPAGVRPSVFYYVQHLLGIGHLARASLIARALAGAGCDVTMVLGGCPVPGFPDASLRTIYLPSLRAGAGGFSELVDDNGNAVCDEFCARRRDELLSAFSAIRPEILIIETYPLGRRQMRFELDPLLEAARQAPWSPLVVCSARDILQEGRRPERIDEAVAILQRSFHVLMVHGDPQFIDFAATFPRAGDISAMTEYTGLVSGPVQPLAGPGFDVVVSAGGGAAGRDIMRAARAAQPLSALHKASWCFLTGPNLPGDVVAELSAGLPANVSLVRQRSDFRALLAASRLSVSQAGYNTAADVLRARCRSIMIPYARGIETEQTRRAGLLAARGLVDVLAENNLTGASLAALIDRTAARPAPALENLPALDGAARSAQILIEKFNQR